MRSPQSQRLLLRSAQASGKSALVARDTSELTRGGGLSVDRSTDKFPDWTKHGADRDLRGANAVSIWGRVERKYRQQQDTRRKLASYPPMPPARTIGKFERPCNLFPTRCNCSKDLKAAVLCFGQIAKIRVQDDYRPPASAISQYVFCRHPQNDTCAPSLALT